MGELKNKIDFVALVSVKNANPNGDPLNGNRPRTDYDGYGEISDVCIKRKIRNRMMDLGNDIFVQSDDKVKDEYKSLSERAGAVLKGIKTRDEYEKVACEKWLDVRTFGQVFAFKSTKDAKVGGGSVGIRGPVSVQQSFSLSPIDIESMQIVKSVNGNPVTGKKADTDEEESASGGKGRDTMGTKHFVKFGLYEIKGSINVQLAEKTGFSEEDADCIKECLRTLFINDASSARPDGSMEIVKLYWFKHNCKDGQYSSKKVHDSVKVQLKEGISIPKDVSDYDFSVEPLEDLEPEIIDGI